MTPPTTRKPGSPPLRPASRRTRLSVPMPTAAHACPQVHRLLTDHQYPFDQPQPAGQRRVQRRVHPDRIRLRGSHRDHLFHSPMTLAIPASALAIRPGRAGCPAGHGNGPWRKAKVSEQSEEQSPRPGSASRPDCRARIQASPRLGGNMLPRPRAAKPNWQYCVPSMVPPHRLAGRSNANWIWPVFRARARNTGQIQIHPPPTRGLLARTMPFESLIVRPGSPRSTNGQ